MQVPTFQLQDTVQPEWREALDEIGAIRFEGFASPDEVAEIRDAWEALCTLFVERGFEKVNGTPIKYGLRPDGKVYVNRFAFSSLYSDRIRAFVRDARFEPVRQLCGPDMRVGENEKDGVVINCYRNEPGSRYKTLGWHTDALRDIFLGRKVGPMYNVGFHIDDSPREKGALRIIPGSHKQGRRGFLFRKPYFIDHRDDPDEVLIETKAGDLTIHDGRLWHRVGKPVWEGEESTRRTMYIPYINGPYQPKHENSPTPLYHRLQWITG